MKELIASRRNLLEIYIIMISGWSVYATCQDDYLLPLLAGFVLSLSVLKQFITPKQIELDHTKKFSWASILSISLLLGWVWITINPREYPSDFIQSYAIFILQSGSIFISLFVWFNFTFIYRVFFLRLLAWLTVSLSVNVFFNQTSLAAFWLFCIINIAIMVFSNMDRFSYKNNKAVPSKMKIRFVYNFFFFIISICLLIFFIVFFKVGDAVYMRFMRDYTFGYKKHHFFKFNPTLEIQGPGFSGQDVHPVLEVDRITVKPMYLTAQVFEEYKNGIWKTNEEIEKLPMTDQLDPVNRPFNLIMFENLKKVIPTPKGINGINGYNGPYEYDRNGIIYSFQKTIHKMELTVNRNTLRDYNSHVEDTDKLLALDPNFSKRLRPYVNYILGDTQDPEMKATMIQNFFRLNYGYSLNTNFKADDNGLIYMLERRPYAYCSFFASAMAVLLREANIPSRLVVGFLATEARGKKKEKFLVRVRDAHAWVEALLPVKDQPGQKRWVRYDPTPPDERLNVLNNGRPINMIADAIWLSIVRFRAEFKNLESEKLLTWLVIILFLLVFIRNYPIIIKLIKNLKSRQLTIANKSSHDAIEQYIEIYKSFEKTINRSFKTKREDAETNWEFLNRLKKHNPSSSQMMTKVEQFLLYYNEVRFGRKMDRPLKAALNEIKKANL